MTNINLLNPKRKRAIQITQSTTLLSLVVAMTLFFFAPAFAESSEQEKLAERYRKQGIKFYEDKKYDDALKQLTYARKLAPKSERIINSLGAVYSSTGQHTLAISCFLKAINLKPNYHKSWLNLANEYVLLGRYSKAMEVINNGKIRFKNVSETMGLLDQSQKYCAAFIKLKKLGKTDKSEPYYRWLNHAEKFVAVGDFESAETTLKDGLRRYPKSQPLGIELAINFERRKMYKLSAKTWKRVAENEPTNPKLVLVLMSAQTKAGDLDGIQAERKKFARNFPNHKLASTMTKMHKHYGSKDKLMKLREKKYGSRDFRAPYVSSYPILVYVHKRYINKTVWNANKLGKVGETDYISLIDQAFDEWVKASHGKLNFKFVKDPDRANIECAWTTDRKKLHLTFAGGVTRYGFNRYRRPKSTIYLLLYKTSFNRGQFYHTCLHEIGHALGLSHSKNPQDIMYFSTGAEVTRRSGLPRLSVNDISRLNKVYGALWGYR